MALFMVTVNGLGYKKVIQLLKAHLEDAPLIVDKMLYWLRPENEELKKEAEALRVVFNEKYPSFTSTRSTGLQSTSA